jgi:hydroxyacylglutathione hydrolase
MNLVALPAFTDNYIWMLHDGRQAVVVDPGEAAPVIAALQAHRLALAGILVTHHHGDHTGGIEALRPLLNGPVWAPARERIPEPNLPLTDGASIDVLGWRAEVIDVPGHTAGHIAYLLQMPGHTPILFCGDTLFSGGCGRLFEGTPAQMYTSLSRLGALDGDTRVCCAHEYTESNLRFALAVEPDNAGLQDYAAHCHRLRAQGQPTLPSRIDTERAVNPFMRCDQPAVISAALTQGAANDSGPAVLGALRAWKNNFR